MLGGGFPDPQQPNIGRYIVWFLDNPPGPVPFGATEHDLDFDSKTCDMAGLEYAYTYSDGVKPVKGFWLHEINVRLRRNNRTGALFLVPTLKWFCYHRTQVPFPPYYFQINGPQGLNARITMPSIMVDCQCTRPPGDVIPRVPPFSIDLTDNPAFDYWQTAVSGQLIMPSEYTGARHPTEKAEHGEICR